MAETIDLKAKDGVEFLGDLYLTDDDNNPFIILFHQAGYSRGEYIEIGPKLNELGFNCLAIDQRSGKTVNEVENTATISATEKEFPTGFHNALPDLEAAVDYVFSYHKPDQLFLLGSSYSSSMVFVLGNIYEGLIDGILSFSPGEYFLIDGKKIEDFSSEIRTPVFVTSSQSEVSKYEEIFNNIPSKDKVAFVPKEAGVHGAKALWKANPNHLEYWDAMTEFLSKHKN